MEIHERIQALRKELGLSRRAFGEKLGVSGDVISNIEYNRLKKPEQKEPIYKSICTEFGVSYQWLVHGRGQQEADGSDEAQKIVDSVMTSNDDFAKSVIVAFARLGKAEWQVVKKIIDDIKKSPD